MPRFLAPGSRLRQIGPSRGVGLSGVVVTPPPPDPTPGQSLVWRALVGRNYDFTSSNAGNFSTVAGTAYGRTGGPRYGTIATDAAWATGGQSLRVPSRQAVAGTPTTVFSGVKSIAGQTAVQTCGFVGAWVHVAGVTSTNPSGTLAIWSASNTNKLASIQVKAITAGGSALRWQSDGLQAGVGSLDIGDVHERVYVAIGWYMPDPVGGTGTKTYRMYAMLPGDSQPTQFASRDDNGVGAAYVPDTVRVNAVYGEYVAADPWYGAVGGLSLYACDALATCGLYPADIARPTTTAVTWRVASTGSDSNDGVVLPWLTGDKIQTEARRGTILGRVVSRAVTDAAGAGVDCRTYSIPNLFLEEDAQIAGNRRWAGDVIRVTGRVESATPINLEQLPGVQVQLDTGAKLTFRKDLTGSSYTNVSGIVWKLADANYGDGTNGGMIYEAGVPLVPQYAADQAAGIAAVQGGAGRVWIDATGIFFSTFGGTDPTSDGIARHASRVLVQTGTAPGVLSVGIGRVYSDGTGTVEGGIGYVYTGGGGAAPLGQYCVGLAGPGHGSVENVIESGGCYHSDVGEEPGPSKSLIFTRVNVKVKGCYSTNGIPHTTYVSAAAASDANTVAVGTYYGCEVTTADGWQGPGEAVGVPQAGTAQYSHSNGAYAGGMGLRVRNCDWSGGSIDPSLLTASSGVISGGTSQGVSTDKLGMTVTNHHITGGKVRTYTGGSIAVTGGTIDCSGPATGQPTGDVVCDGPVTLTGVTVNLLAAAVSRVTTLMSLSIGITGTVSGCDITLGSRLMFKAALQAQWVASNNTYHGSAGDVIGAIGGVNKTLAQLQALGLEVGSVMVP